MSVLFHPIADENIEINGHHISYGIYGEGCPVVLIHGASRSSTVWGDLVPLLVDAGYSVYLLDMAGFGESDRLVYNGNKCFCAQGSIMTSLLDPWNIQRADFITHETGGNLGQLLCVDNWHRMLSLTMIDPVANGGDCSASASRPTPTHLDNPRNPLILRFLQQLHVANCLLSTQGQLLPAAVPVLQDNRHNTVGLQCIAQKAFNEPDRMHKLGCEMHAQLIVGENGNSEAVFYAKLLRDLIPGCEVRTLGSIGFDSPEDEPAEVARLVLEFIECDDDDEGCVK